MSLTILQVHCRYRELGGEDTVADHEAAILTGAGHDVHRHIVENPHHGARSAIGLMAAPYNLRSATAVAAVARTLRPDIAHVHNTWFSLSPAVLPALRRSGTPVVVTLHNYRLTCANGLLFRDGHPCERCVQGSPLHGVALRCYRHSALASAAVVATTALHRRLGTWNRDVDAVIVPSAFARDRLAAAGLPAERLHVLPHSVPDAGERPAPSTSATVLYVGRLTPEKGVTELIQAWIDAAAVGLELRLIGDGPLASQLAATQIPGITFLGPLNAEEVRAQMLRARALVFPSLWYETYGRVAAEAFSAGLPVLATDIGAVAELVQPALGNHWVVPPRDRLAWRDRLRSLTDNELVDVAGTAARAAFVTALSPAAGLRRLEAVYASVLG